MRSMRRKPSLVSFKRAAFGDKAFIVIYLVPTLALYLLFCVWPAVHALVISFTERSAFSTKMTLVGLANYTRLLGDPVVWKALGNNIFLLFSVTVITFVLSMFFAAVITHKKYRISKYFSTVSFFPYILSIAVVAIIWVFIFNPSFGILNKLLALVGLPPQVWLGDRRIIMWSLTIPLVWINTGFFTLLFVAGIRNIPESVFEAAQIDGAGALETFFTITLPQILSVARVALVFFVVTAFNYSFELVWATTKGGPNRASELLTTYLYQTAFIKNEYGYASTVGVLLFVIVAAIIFVLMRALRPSEEVEHGKTAQKA